MSVRLGAHVSTAGGVSTAFARATTTGCDTMQIFTRNNNRWQSKPLPAEEIASWQAFVAEGRVQPVVSHAAYLINLGSPDPEQWRRSIDAYTDELERAEALRLLGVVIHPGSHMGEGETHGIKRIAEGLNACHERTPGARTLTLLETTAGTGNHLGYRFEQLAAIRDRCFAPDRVAICFDTCHVFAAGYDIRTPDAYESVMASFERHVGLELIKCFHLNDSKHDLGSRRDRHTHIGAGYIGRDGFRWLLNDGRFPEVPMILETPKSKDMHEDVENLAILRALIG